jgi:hypothetical protein
LVQNAGMTTKRGDKDKRIGPVYDTALRHLMETDMNAACRLLHVPVTGKPKLLSAALSTTKLEADLVVRTAPSRLMHVEYMRDSSSDLVARMLIYRGFIRRKYPGEWLGQHVIVLGDGWVKGYDDPTQGFTLDLHVMYLRQMDPEVFLAEPALAALAVLSRGDAQARAQAYAASLRAIQDAGGPHRAERLELAAMLAPIRLDLDTIERVTEEAGMSIEELAEFYSEAKFAQRQRQQARDEGREEGRDEGLDQGRVETLAALLHDRFGEHPDLLTAARNLAGWPDKSAAIRVITGASTVEDLLGPPLT